MLAKAISQRLLIQMRLTTSGSVVRLASSSRQRLLSGLDLYKDIGYEAPFDEEEKSIILQQINGCDSAPALHELGVAKTFASKLFDLKEARGGGFEVLEQLLDLDGFNESRLERLGKAIVKQTRSEQVAEEEKNARRDERRRRALLNCFTPKHLLSSNPTSVESVMGLKLSLESLSLALMSKEVLEELHIVSVPTYGHVSRTSLDPMRSLRVAKQLSDVIPHADLYAIDFPNVMTAKNDKAVFIKAEQQMLTTALIALLSQRCEHLDFDDDFDDDDEGNEQDKAHVSPSKNCVVVKKQFLKQLFHLEIDNEWLSVADLARALVLVDDRPHVHQPVLEAHLPLDLQVPRLRSPQSLTEFISNQVKGTTRSEQIGSALMIAVGTRYLLDWTIRTECGEQ